MDSILRLRGVMQATGMSRSAVYLAVKRGLMPAPIKILGSRAVGWPRSEIDKLVNDMVSACRGVQSPSTP